VHRETHTFRHDAHLADRCQCIVVDAGKPLERTTAAIALGQIRWQGNGECVIHADMLPATPGLVS